mmetsp:Transcript_21460/g.42543  ORF Transcript_21460/g.42543 Transcript_21460/m.42543 type:complete len:252 (+) Transcript_21460:3-758(+)
MRIVPFHGDETEMQSHYGDVPSRQEDGEDGVSTGREGGVVGGGGGGRTDVAGHVGRAKGEEGDGRVEEEGVGELDLVAGAVIEGKRAVGVVDGEEVGDEVGDHEGGDARRIIQISIPHRRDAAIRMSFIRSSIRIGTPHHPIQPRVLLNLLPTTPNRHRHHRPKRTHPQSDVRFPRVIHHPAPSADHAPGIVTGRDALGEFVPQRFVSKGKGDEEGEEGEEGGEEEEEGAEGCEGSLRRGEGERGGRGGEE